MSYRYQLPSNLGCLFLQINCFNYLLDVSTSEYSNKSICKAIAVEQVNHTKYAFPYSPFAILHSKGAEKSTPVISYTLLDDVQKLGS